MDKRCELYIKMVKLIGDIYKENKEYETTLEIIKLYNLDKDDLIDEWKNILRYIQKLYKSYDKKIKEIIESNADIKIKTGIDNYSNYLIYIYNKIYKDNVIDIDLMLLMIIPSISIEMNNGIELIDFNIGTSFNNRILNIANDDNIRKECCPICCNNFKYYLIISNCCCFKTCLRCYELMNRKCAICKGEKTVIMII